MMNEIYKKAYEAGRQDVLDEAKCYKHIIYADICGSILKLKENGSIGFEAYKRVMKEIDIAFMEKKNE